MELKYRNLEDLIPYVNNTRTHSEEQINQIASSINEFGWTNPILLDENNGVIAGHGRIMAGKKLGHTEAPTIVLSGLSEAQKKAYIIADNKLALNAGWDEELLKVEIEQLKEWEFDIDLLGFSIDELNDLDIGLEDITYDEDKADDVPELEENPVIKLGDLIELGHNYQHRLLCGDSTSEDDVTRLMDGKKADMIITDPPYNINFKPQRGTHEKIKNDSMTDEMFEEFLSNVFKMCKFALNEDTYILSFMGWSTIPSFNKAISKYFDIKSMPIWKKNNFGIGYYTRPQYEPFYLCLNGNPIKPEKAPSDVFEFSKVHKTIHSCEKPTEMLEFIANIFNKNGLFYEPFGGSGSMLISCENTNRFCYSMELDEKYAQVIIQRYVDYTSNPMIKINGEEVDWNTYKEENS